MSVPTHLSGCQSRMWRTSCPDCSERVFYFSCTCGSKVFFESAGAPWPLHANNCIPYRVRVYRAQGHTARDARQLIADEAIRRGVKVPAEVAAKLQRDEFGETGRETIIEVVPQGDGQEIRGTVMSESLQVNFFKRLGYPDNVVSRGFLGRLVVEEYVELRVRADPDPEYGYAAEVACFLSLAQYRKNQIRVGKVFSLELKSHRLPNDREVWLVSRLR